MEIVDISPTDPKILAAAKAYVEGEYNEGHAIELADRVHTLIVMLDELLTDHPAVIKFELHDRVETIGLELAELYSEAGEISFSQA